MINKWLKYNAFQGEQNRSLPWLRVLFGIIDFRPNLMITKYKYEKKIKKLKVERLGHIHIPKTGGSYLNSLSDNEFLHLNFNHVVVRDDRSDELCPIGLTPIKKQKLEGYFLFSTVRNPLTFLISYYHHVKNFGDYINSKNYDYEDAQKGFKHLVLKIINRTDKWPSRNFLFPQLFNDKGEIVVDWINKNETLDNDIKELATKFDIKIPTKKESIRVSPKKISNEEYYDQELLKLVLNIYSREMNLFGYDRFKTVDSTIDLRNFKNSNYNYDYKNDILIQKEKNEII